MGREPENQRVIEEHAARFRDLHDPRAGFMESDEFRKLLEMPLARVDDVGVKPLSSPPRRDAIWIFQGITHALNWDAALDESPCGLGGIFVR